MSVYARYEDPGRREHLPSVPAIRSRDPLLEALGPAPDVLCTIDFESYHDSDYSLRKLTTEGYVRDPRFEVIGVGVKLGPHPTVWLEEHEFREWASRVDWNRVAVCAHHAQFDGLILSHHYGIRPAFLLCTMSMARAFHDEARLKYLGPLYGAGEKGDEVENTKGKRRGNFTPEEWERFGAYCRQDVAITEKILHAMVRRLPPYELWLIDTVVRMFTEPAFDADRAVLVRARDDERTKKLRMLRKIADDPESARAVLASNDKFAALLRSLGEEPPTKISKTTGETAWAFAKSDPGMQALLEHERDDVRAVAETRLAVKSTITETRAERIIGIAERGPVTIYLKMYGAHTHRMSGGDKMNPQNFNRGGDLRNALIVDEGRRIAVADSGQIEARVLAWLAGDQRLLETFRRNDATGGDFYSDVGGQLFLMKLSKKETPIERQLAKNMILGLGFSMGWAKFAGEQLKGMLGSKPVQFTDREVQKYRVDVHGFEGRQWGRSGKTCGQIVDEMRTGGIRLSRADLLVHCAVADYLVRLYREKNGPIVQLWRAMDVVLKEMIRDGDPEVVRMTVGPLKIRRGSIEKPSGLRLRYPELRQRKDGSFTYLAGREHSKVYGALLAENCVQSIARDIVMEQALWIRAKFATPERRSVIATTTHDEVVSIVPADLGAECLAYSLERMKIPPAWCSDLPLNASGGVSTSYGAVK